ncbi:MAG: HNH endonuclease [Acidimicrobiales bacterium]|jgi:hypothetical protein|nr:HNH endonuclease [Acidimicrobiales bacterium]
MAEKGDSDTETGVEADAEVGTDPGVGHGSDDAVVRSLLEARDRLEARLCEALVRFFSTGGHDVEGWRSPVGWLKANGGLTDREAKRLAVRALRLGRWPELAGLWFTGGVSGAQVDTVTALVPTHLVDLYADHDAEVSPCLVGLDAARTRIAVREWVLRAESVLAPDPAATDAPAPVDARVHLSRTMGGRGILDGDLDPLTAELLTSALRVLERPDEPGGFRTAAERRGEALRAMTRFVLDHHDSRGQRPGRQHPHVVAVMDLPDLYAAMLAALGVRTAADLDLLLAARPTSLVEEALLRHALVASTGAATAPDGHRLPPAAVRELFGDGTTIERLVTARGRVLDHGRRIRLADGALRDALVVRDQGCRFPGCDASAEWIDAHHLRRWTDGGPTSLANLVGLCGSHHGVVHRQGWALTCARDGTLTFTRPDGISLTSPPPRARSALCLPLRLPPLDELLPEPVGAGSLPGDDDGRPLHRTGVHHGHRWHLHLSSEPAVDEDAAAAAARRRFADLARAA